MKKKLQVFVSSTYKDMLPERQAAVEAILQAGHIPAGMELFASGDESQWDTIRRWIDDSDVFLLILGGRYGSVEPKSGKSYIQLEYEYAAEVNKPRFAAVIDESYLKAKIKKAGASVLEQSHPQELTEFRDTVMRKICKFFKDTKEIQLIVFQSLSNLDRVDTLSGWVRGTDVIDPRIAFEEVTRLQTENSELRRQANEAQGIITYLKSTQNDRKNAVLSDDAKALLVAAKKSDGAIYYFKYAGGTEIQAGGENFIEPLTSEREHARWKAALQELQNQQLIEMVGYKEEYYTLTKLGYEVADKIEAAQAVSDPDD